jgi:predicted O-methyltransferase YrrM
MPGHIQLTQEIKNNRGNFQDAYMVEIGTTREILNGHDSTKHLYEFCQKNNIEFVTVDMDSENTENAKKRFQGINAITQKGEDFLESCTRKIDFVYLDAFDFFHNFHSDKRKAKYKNILNCEITNEACHKMHLDCAKSLVRKMNKNGIVTFDDILNKNLDGKGKLAIPYLIQNGFKIIKEDYQIKSVTLEKII